MFEKVIKQLAIAFKGVLLRYIHASVIPLQTETT